MPSRSEGGNIMSDDLHFSKAIRTIFLTGVGAVAAGAEIMGRGKEAAVVREAGEVLGIAVALICTASVLSVIAVGVFAGSLPGG